MTRLEGKREKKKRVGSKQN